MIYFIFEDAEDTPSSELLKHSYAGSDILFAGGNETTNIITKIDLCKSQDKGFT